MSQPQEITFHNAAPRIGQRSLLTAEEETQIAFGGTRTSDGAPVRNLSTLRARRVRREEILAVRGTVAERQRVTFIEDAAAEEAGGETRRRVGPLAGSTFEIERKRDSDDLTVYDAYDAGGAPSRPEVAAQVARLFRDFGRAPTIKLPVGPQRIGDSAPELAESMAAEMTGGAPNSRIGSRDAVLAEIRPGADGALHGLYRVALNVTSEARGSLITMDLAGTVLLRDLDGAPVEIRLAGPLFSTPDPSAPDENIPAGAGELKMIQTMVSG